MMYPFGHCAAVLFFIAATFWFGGYAAGTCAVIALAWLVLWGADNA